MYNVEKPSIPVVCTIQAYTLFTLLTARTEDKNTKKNQGVTTLLDNSGRKKIRSGTRLFPFVILTFRPSKKEKINFTCKTAQKNRRGSAICT